MEDDCTVDFADKIPDHVTIIPIKDRAIKNVPILDLRRQKEIVLPDGICEIGDYWFRDCKVESVTIPVSVRSIGT